MTDLDGATLRGMIPPDWLSAMEAAAGDLDLDGLATRLRNERRPILPSRGRWFRALELTPLPSVRAVILGQDPYPDADLAEGLAFSVPPGEKLSLSLRRILAEARAVTAVGDEVRSLLPWAKRGALLLNTALTVPEGVAGGHLRIGWRDVTEAILRAVVRQQHPVVFFAWGRPAQAILIRVGIADGSDHIVCADYHPADRRSRFVTADMPISLWADTDFLAGGQLISTSADS